MLSVAKHPHYNEETLRFAQGDGMLFIQPRKTRGNAVFFLFITTEITENTEFF
jgi:hypothetical protein